MGLTDLVFDNAVKISVGLSATEYISGTIGVINIYQEDFKSAAIAGGVCLGSRLLNGIWKHFTYDPLSARERSVINKGMLFK